MIAAQKSSRNICEALHDTGVTKFNYGFTPQCPRRMRLQGSEQGRKKYDQTLTTDGYAQRLHHKKQTPQPNWLMRSLLNAQLKNYTAAERDLQRSTRYLEIPDAHYYLGQVYEQQGNTKNAVSHYQIAAKDSGDIGTKAQARVQALGNQG